MTCTYLGMDVLTVEQSTYREFMQACRYGDVGVMPAIKLLLCHLAQLLLEIRLFLVIRLLSGICQILVRDPTLACNRAPPRHLAFTIHLPPTIYQVRA